MYKFILNKIFIHSYVIGACKHIQAPIILEPNIRFMHDRLNHQQISLQLPVQLQSLTP